PWKHRRHLDRAGSRRSEQKRSYLAHRVCPKLAATLHHRIHLAGHHDPDRDHDGDRESGCGPVDADGAGSADHRRDGGGYHHGYRHPSRRSYPAVDHACRADHAVLYGCDLDHGAVGYAYVDRGRPDAHRSHQRRVVSTAADHHARCLAVTSFRRATAVAGRVTICCRSIRFDGKTCCRGTADCGSWTYCPCPADPANLAEYSCSQRELLWCWPAQQAARHLWSLRHYRETSAL